MECFAAELGVFGRKPDHKIGLRRTDLLLTSFLASSYWIVTLSNVHVAVADVL